MHHIEVKAYAKINLYLDIVSKLNNGFHEIESVMQTVSLADDIVIDVKEQDVSKITVSCNSDHAPDGEGNIVYRAASLYLERSGIKAQVTIDLKKNIPSPAGMGGGSADAAAVLRGLNEIYGAFSISELECLAAELGSDVPFCVRGGTQIAKGRGEKLFPCKEMPDCFLVVACGGEGLSTPLAYRMLDERFDDFKTACGSRDKLVAFENKMDKLSEMCLELYNIFESVTAEYCVEMPKLKNELKRNGAIGTLMCGSGPAVFGVFDDVNVANKAVDVLKKSGSFAALCTPLKS